MKKLSEETLKQALEMVANKEVEEIEKQFSGKPTFETSQEFEEKMQKLIKRASKPYYKFTSKGFKRTFVIIAAVLVLMLSAFSASAVRDSASDFFGRVFLGNKTSQKDKNKNKNEVKVKPTSKPISTEKSTQAKETIKIIYELGYVPDGFELYSYGNTGYESKTEYVRDEDKIIFTQFSKGSYVKTVDDETVFKETEYIGEQKYRIYTCTYSSEITVVWNNGEYVFSMYSTLPKDEVMTLCENIKIKPQSNFKDVIEMVYKLDKTPEEFNLVDYFIDEDKVIYTYSSGDKTFVFTQNVKYSYNSPQDGSAQKSVEIYDNKQYTIYTWDNGESNISWDNTEYIFDIKSAFSKEEVIALSQSVSVVGERKYTEKIENVYKLDDLPSAFKLISFEKGKTEVITKYSSTNGFIKLKQYPNQSYSFGADIENAKKSLKVIDGIKYIIYRIDSSNDTVVVWEDNGYVFSLRSSLSEDKIINISKTVKLGEPKKESPEKTTNKNNNNNKKPTTTRPKTIDKIYELGFVPDGYSLVEYASETSNVSYVYYQNDDILMFSQNLESVYSSSIDKQSATKTVETHNYKEYTIYTWKTGEINIIWNDGEFIFDLYGKLDKQQAIDMCNSIKIKEN